MNTQLLKIGIAQALLIAGVTAQASHVDPYALEPSINGGVSASGLFASQAAEDRYHAERLALELEPCINGSVSASGRFASQAEENEWINRVAGG
jgi:hypothetical protein